MIYIFLIVILIFSIVLHEISHGAVAYYLGDPTAKKAGRLTLNPIPHLDPVGSILLPAILIIIATIAKGGIIFGWAKPVPINPANLRDKKYGEAKVSLAGPAANFSLALVFAGFLRFVPGLAEIASLRLILGYVIFINILLAIFNLLPIPPLDGSHILFTFLPSSMRNVKMFLYRYGFFILIFVIFFFFQWLLPVILGIYELIVGFPFVI